VAHLAHLAQLAAFLSQLAYHCWSALVGRGCAVESEAAAMGVIQREVFQPRPAELLVVMQYKRDRASWGPTTRRL
jgi:hypothetical protein